MADDKKIAAHIAETDESNYAVTIEVNGHRLTGDEPESFGGGNTGPAPYDYLLAALGECTAMTMRWYALKHDWPLEKTEVRLSYQKKEKLDTFQKEITLHGDKLSDEQRQKLIEVAAKCPVQRTLEGKVEITTA